MITQLCRDYLKYLAGKSKTELGPTGADSKPFIRSIGNRAVELASLLASSWPLADTSAGPYSLSPVASLTTDDMTPRLLAGGLLLLGASGNGDPLVVALDAKDVLSCEVGLISHEQWAESNDPRKEIYAPVCSDILELLCRAVEERYLPCDYFMAMEHNRVKARLGK